MRPVSVFGILGSIFLLLIIIGAGAEIMENLGSDHKCPECGHNEWAGSDYCSKCGHEIDGN